MLLILLPLLLLLIRPFFLLPPTSSVTLPQTPLFFRISRLNGAGQPPPTKYAVATDKTQAAEFTISTLWNAIAPSFSLTPSSDQNEADKRNSDEASSGKTSGDDAGTSNSSVDESSSDQASMDKTRINQASSGIASKRRAGGADGVDFGIGASGVGVDGLSAGVGGGVAGRDGGGPQATNGDLDKAKISVDGIQGSFVENIGVPGAGTDGFDATKNISRGSKGRLSGEPGGFVDRNVPSGDGGEEGECEDVDGDGQALPEVRVWSLRCL